MLITIGSIFLGIIFWISSPESLRRRLRQFFAGLFRRHPAVAIEPDIAMFDGRVEILTDDLLSHPADAARKKRFYEAVAPLDWDIIAANADVERDKQADLLKWLKQPADSLRFVCIHGEPGSGKSTLAWRIAADLYKRHHALVVRVRDKEEPEVWYRMTEFCRRAHQPVYVLADDIFRDTEVRKSLRELSPWLPLTILATSQTNEYSPGRLKGQLLSVLLEPPSSPEKRRVLDCLGQDPKDFCPDQSNRFREANEFLVLMVELTGGKGFQDIVRDSLENLQRQHEPVYRAYEYLCFAYSYGLAIPASLLERLDTQGRFRDLPNREGAKNWVYYDEDRSHYLRPGHLRRAELSSAVYQRLRPSTVVLEELVNNVDVSAPLERRFVAHLLRILAYRERHVVENALPSIQQQIAACIQQSCRVTELTIWRAFYLGFDRPDEAERCVDAALVLEPVSAADVNVVLNLFRERGLERQALPVFECWIRSHTEWGGGGPAYLGLIERYGTEGDRERAIANTSNWLATHSNDNYVRTAYLGLVEHKGTAEQTERVLKDTSGWLSTHPDDSAVRIAYLGLVERKGTAEQTELVLKKTSTWLREHPNATNVWARFISCLCSVGRLDDARDFVKDVIVIHSANSNIVTLYLRLMADHLDEATTRELYVSLIKLFPRDTTIKNVWARWLHSRNYLDDAEQVFKQLIADHPRSFLHWYGYGKLLLDMERHDEAAHQFEQVISIHRGHAMAHDGLALALQNLARRAEETHDTSKATRLFSAAEREFKNALYWAVVAKNRQAIFLTHLGWLYVGRKRWTDALDAFDQAMNEDPEYFGNHWGRGCALVGLEQYRDAVRVLRTAQEKLPESLRPPVSDDIQQLIERCEAAP